MVRLKMNLDYLLIKLAVCTSSDALVNVFLPTDRQTSTFQWGQRLSTAPRQHLPERTGVFITLPVEPLQPERH